MRVEINSKNDNELYKKRWRQINEVLEKKGITDYRIDKLADYYSHIQEISQLEESSGRFMLMPLDEEPIYFDTNTRKLQIPNHFIRNGISVQGDHLAEEIIFKVPRYFDVHDLGTGKNIYINWEFIPADKAIESANGVDPIQYTDTTLDPDYIFFGWYITNQITYTKGNLKFSVVFVSDDTLINNTVLSKTSAGFRLNSSPATLTVVEGLDYGILEPNVQQRQLENIQNTLINSIYTTPDELPVLSKPKILNTSTLSQKTYTNIDYDTGVNDSVILTVDAFSESLQSDLSAKIVYRWNGPEIATSPDPLYKEVESGATYSDNLNYYIENSGVYESYAFSGAEEYNTFLADSDNRLYLQYSAIEATTPGTYSCIVSTQGTHVIDGNLTQYYSLQANPSTTICPAGKPEVEWNLDAMDANYIERDDNNFILYADSSHPIQITGQVKGITVQKVDGLQTMNLFPSSGTNEEAMDFLGKITYGIVDQIDETSFMTGKTQEKINNTDACTLELLNEDFIDESIIKVGAKHRKNNGEWNDGAIAINEDQTFACYHMPTNITEGKFKIKTFDGDTEDLGVDSGSSDSIVFLPKMTPDEGESPTNYSWPTINYGQLTYDWQYKRTKGGEFVSFDNSVNGNSSLTIRANMFPAVAPGSTDYYYIRLIIINTNGNKFYTCTSTNGADGFRLMIIGDEV